MNSLPVVQKYVDDNTFFKMKDLRIYGKVVRTPLKATTPGYLRIKTFYEIYKKVTSENLQKMIEDDTSYIESFQHKLKYYTKNLTDESIPILFISYDNKEKVIPSEKELERIFLIQSPWEYSSFYVLPLLAGKIANVKEEKIVSDVRNAFEILESFTLKPRFLTIRIDMNLLLIGKLIKKFDFDGICIDFKNRVPTSILLQMIQINRYIKEEMKDVILYGINLRPGLKKKENPVIPAKDVLSYALGVDILGNNHMPPPPVRDFANNVPSRIFNRKDYGYYYVVSDDVLDFVYERDSIIPIELLKSGSKEAYKYYNDEAIYKEMEYIKKRVDEGDEPYEIFSQKTQIKDPLKNIAKEKKKGKTTMLEDFL